MIRTRFQYRRWFRIDATPAQFAGLVQQLNALYLTDEPKQVLFDELHGLEGPLFFVYGLPLPDNAPLVTVRYPGNGEVGQDYRDPHYGWIDAMARLDGRTDLVMAYNFSTQVLPIDTRLLLWKLLFDWLSVSGCPVMPPHAVDATPAVITSEGNTPPKGGTRGTSEKTDAKALEALHLYRDKMMTQAEVAERIGRSVRTVKRLLKRAEGLGTK